MTDHGQQDLFATSKMNGVKTLFLMLSFILIIFGIHNYKLYEVTAFNDIERALLYSIHMKEGNITFLNSVTSEATIPMNVIVIDDKVDFFEKKLNKSYIEYTLKETKSELEDLLQINNFTKYTWKDIQKMMNHLSTAQNSIIETIRIGKTYGKNNLIVFKISKGKKKCAAFFLGGEDARDSNSAVIILNLMKRIIGNKKISNTLLNELDMYFLPVLNPDGLRYNLQKNILWSKNRQKIIPNKFCKKKKIAIGVNIERDWLINSGESYNKECNYVYKGVNAFRAEETKALSIYLRQISQNLITFINLRSFHGMISIPYSNKLQFSKNDAILMEILNSVCEKIHKIHGVSYFYGNTASLIYNFSGNCADWVKKELNIPAVFTVYLKYDNSVFPQRNNVKILTDIYSTILEEALHLTESLYEPLFNKILAVNSDFIILLLCLLIFF